ncbi:MAG: TonB-dependent receptor, partial [Chitinophagales bacterium]
MRFLVLLSLTTCLAFNAIHAQQATLKGKVIDENKEGLPFAYVISEAGPATTTDVDGYYSLSLDAGDHVITFSYVGYSSQQRSFSINSGQNLTLDVNMTEDMERLNVTIISASRYEKNIAEETVSVNVVDKDFLENTNSRDIGEAINQTAGVQVQDGQISIRSGSSWSYGVGSRTALLQDGIGLQTADLGESMLKFAAIETVDQVEIIKGASSVVYGSSALNGVVNLVTKWPKKNDQYTDIIPYYGFYGAPPRAELNWWKGEVGGRQPGLFGVFVSHYRGG